MARSMQSCSAVRRLVALVIAIVAMVAATIAAAEPCPRDGLYGESTFAVGSSIRLSGDILEGGPLLLNRAALGWSVHECPDDVGVRLALALVYATDDPGASISLGFGLEAEANYAVTPELRLGVRAGVDHHGFASATSDGATVMPMFGLRARVRDTVAVGVDGAYVHYGSSVWGRSTSAGVMATIAVQGRPGVLGPINVGILLLGFAGAILQRTED
jgi:hypothetical protein